jgi:hypothetical protein
MANRWLRRLILGRTPEEQAQVRAILPRLLLGVFAHCIAACVLLEPGFCCFWPPLAIAFVLGRELGCREFWYVLALVATATGLLLLGIWR